MQMWMFIEPMTCGHLGLDGKYIFAYLNTKNMLILAKSITIDSKIPLNWKIFYFNQVLQHGIDRFGFNDMIFFWEFWEVINIYAYTYIPMHYALHTLFGIPFCYIEVILKNLIIMELYIKRKYPCGPWVYACMHMIHDFHVIFNENLVI